MHTHCSEAATCICILAKGSSSGNEVWEDAVPKERIPGGGIMSRTQPNILL